MAWRASGASGESILDAATRNHNRFVEEQIATVQSPGGPTCVKLPPTMSRDQVKHARRVAAQYGLCFGFIGEGDLRRSVVYKPGAPDAPKPEELNVGMPQDEQLSRKLTSVLRHRALELGLDMTEEGWVRVTDILALDMFAGSTTTEHIDAIVSQKDQKKRFSLEWWEDERWIRANQGHSIKTVAEDPSLQPISSAEEAPCCVHGTYLFAWEQIFRSGGLSRMTRNHIHFSPRPPGAGEVISGMRRDCEVAIFISLDSAIAAGLKFFRSANQVILTSGDEQGMVPLAHFMHVVRLSDGDVIWKPEQEYGHEPVQKYARSVGQGWQ